MEKEDVVKYWKRNRRQLASTIVHLNRFHLRSIRKGTKLNDLYLDNVFSKIILPFWISLVEIEFNILINENIIYTEDFVKHLPTNASEIEKWICLIKYYFKKQYLGRQDRKLDKISVGDTNFHRYDTLIELAKDGLGTFIEIRNRLAHGQWCVTFNNTVSSKNDELTRLVNVLSKKDLLILKAYAVNMPKILKLLMVSKKTFERDYDEYIGKILRARANAIMVYEWLKNREH